MKTLYMPVSRTQDAHGAGHYHASRGTKLHNGEDIPASQGSKVIAVCDGTINRIGYPYSPEDERRGHLRLIEMHTDNGETLRYFYVRPMGGIKPGVRVEAGNCIGLAQGLLDVYPGITDHIHFEVKDMLENYVNPLLWLGKLWEKQSA